MRKLIRSRNLFAAMMAISALVALESTASAWPVNRFYRTGSTNTVANALRNDKFTETISESQAMSSSSESKPQSNWHARHPQRKLQSRFKKRANWWLLRPK